jgi:hypothetical protein
MTTTSMSCELAVIQYPHLVSTAQRRVLHLQSRQWHVSNIDTMNYHRVEFHVCKCLEISSLIEYASAQDFVEFDRISNVKMKSVVDFRTECKILKEPYLEMPISSDDNSTSTMRGKPWSDIDETSGIDYSNTNESTGAVGFQFRATPKIHFF